MELQIEISIYQQVIIPNNIIGLDTINHIAIKPIITGGSIATKYMLLIKTQSPKGSKYEFKFNLYSDKDVHVFNKAI